MYCFTWKLSSTSITSQKFGHIFHSATFRTKTPFPPFPRRSYWDLDPPQSMYLRLMLARCLLEDFFPPMFLEIHRCFDIYLLILVGSLVHVLHVPLSIIEWESANFACCGDQGTCLKKRTRNLLDSPVVKKGEESCPHALSEGKAKQESMP